jgi:DNA repair exonuclease SbcCD nuclease subunit
MARIVATADLHIDGGRGGGVNPVTQRARSAESVHAIWMEICQRAVEERAVLVSAGDLFLDGHPLPEYEEMLAEGHRLVSGAGLEQVIVRGNHDSRHLALSHRDPLGRFADLPGCHVVSEPSLLRLAAGISVVALPWPRSYDYLGPDEGEGLGLEELDALVASRAAARLGQLIDQAAAFGDPVVVVCHCSVDAAVLSSPRRGAEVVLGKLLHEPVLPLSAFDRDPVACVIAGHIHRPQQLGQRFYYCGSPDRHDAGEAEQDKRYLLIDVARQGLAHVESVPTPARRFCRLEVGAETQASALVAAPGAIVKVRLAHDARLSPAEIAAGLRAAGAADVVFEREPPPAPVATTRAVAVSVGEVEGLRAYLDAAGVGPEEQAAVLAEAEALLAELGADEGRS